MSDRGGGSQTPSDPRVQQQEQAQQQAMQDQQDQLANNPLNKPVQGLASTTPAVPPPPLTDQLNKGYKMINGGKVPWRF
jgi:hypothetical protein